MKVGDLVKRRSTGEVDIVIEVRNDRERYIPGGGRSISIVGPCVRCCRHNPLSSASNWEVVSESR